MDWIAYTEIGLDPNNSIIKRLCCIDVARFTGADFVFHDNFRLAKGKQNTCIVQKVMTTLHSKKVLFP